MDAKPANSTPTKPAGAPLKAKRLRRATIARGGHAWVFVCAAGEEAQLVRSACELGGPGEAPLAMFEIAFLARQLGVCLEALNPPVRKAD